MAVLHSDARSALVIPPASPSANSDAAKLQLSVEGLRWKRVRNSGNWIPRVLHWACSDLGYFAGR